MQTNPLPHPKLEQDWIPVLMVAPERSWRRIQNAELPWDPADLLGRIFDASVDAVADAVAEAEEPGRHRAA